MCGHLCSATAIRLERIGSLSHRTPVGTCFEVRYVTGWEVTGLVEFDDAHKVRWRGWKGRRDPVHECRLRRKPAAQPCLDIAEPDGDRLSVKRNRLAGVCWQHCDLRSQHPAALQW